MTKIKTELFPVPDSHYAKGTFMEGNVALSILSLNLHITGSRFNLLSREVKRGHYFFRDESIPLPRAATILAWDRICRLGTSESPIFVLPFLPSLRDDDEIGQAIAERGVKIQSLSRRSQLHVRDSDDRIIWGPLYFADTRRAGDDSVLCGTAMRSNVSESAIVTGLFQHAGSAQDSIRMRMESLASHGLLGCGEMCAAIGIPHATRVLFQFLSRNAAEKWANAYVAAKQLVAADPRSAESDYKELMFELIAQRKAAESQQETGDLPGKKPKEKNIPKSGSFGAIPDLGF